MQRCHFCAMLVTVHLSKHLSLGRDNLKSRIRSSDLWHLFENIQRFGDRNWGNVKRLYCEISHLPSEIVTFYWVARPSGYSNYCMQKITKTETLDIYKTEYSEVNIQKYIVRNKVISTQFHHVCKVTGNIHACLG